MPPLADVPGVLRVILGYEVGGDLTNLTRLYYRYGGTPPTSSILSSWCNSIATNWTTHCGQLTGTETALTSVSATDLTNTAAGAATVVVDVPGTRSGSRLPGGTAVLVNYTVARRYRGGKPRSYCPFGTSTDVQTRQTWTAAFVGLCNTEWGAFIHANETTTPPTGTNGVKLCSVSYYSGFTVHTTSTGRAQNIPTPRDVPLIDDIVGIFIDGSFGSQRRRARG